ncbi:MAG: Holliday junction resolvase RecU [Thermoplasmata archaeon]|nr:Holliday junction resolvase RecU [Thermoplasmata archaeon]
MAHTPQKPFDFELFYKGYFFALEAKHQKSHLDFRRVKAHQLESMRSVEVNGGFAFFFIRIEDPKKTHDKFRAFIISRKHLKKLIEESPKASCNAKELEGIAEFEAERIKLPAGEYTWNFPEFFQEFVRKGGFED